MTDITYMEQGDAGPRVSELTPGSELTCWVNPKNPAEAVLYKPWKIQVFVSWFGFIIGWIMTVMGAVILKRVVFNDPVKEA